MVGRINISDINTAGIFDEANRLEALACSERHWGIREVFRRLFKADERLIGIYWFVNHDNDGRYIEDLGITCATRDGRISVGSCWGRGISESNIAVPVELRALMENVSDFFSNNFSVTDMDSNFGCGSGDFEIKRSNVLPEWKHTFKD